MSYVSNRIAVLTERMEMASMTKASEIAPNVYLGPSPDPILNPSVESEDFDVLIEASDLAQMPDAKTLKSIKSILRDPERPKVQFEVPGSGSIMPPTWSHTEVDGLLEICHWIWDLTRDDDSNAEANSEGSPDSLTASENESDELSFDSEGDIVMNAAPAVQSPRTSRKVLIHCADGYTESTLLGITYFMYAHGLQVSEAWIRMHRELRRNFFAYPTDVALLTSIQPRILSVSPARQSSDPCLSLSSLPVDPEWLSKMDGSLPSRILDYMYLGNLSHANNPALLRELGIQRIVSVGEKVSCPGGQPVSQVKTIEGGAFDGFEFLVVENVQDNGVDGLSEEFERCLDFIGMFA
jgi:dual specificity MAP kinase phosphatase